MSLPLHLELRSAHSASIASHVGLHRSLAPVNIGRIVQVHKRRVRHIQPVHDQLVHASSNDIPTSNEESDDSVMEHFRHVIVLFHRFITHTRSIVLRYV